MTKRKTMLHVCQTPVRKLEEILSRCFVEKIIVSKFYSEKGSYNFGNNDGPLVNFSTILWTNINCGGRSTAQPRRGTMQETNQFFTFNNYASFLMFCTCRTDVAFTAYRARW